MNTQVELLDSRVTEICERDGQMIVGFLPAYLHESEARPEFDSGIGRVQEVRLILSDASVNGDRPDLPCHVMGGEFDAGVERHDIAIPVPPVGTVDTELRLSFDPIHAVTVAGRGVRLELLGEPRYVEEFKP